jgi:catechol 2,3-dioxygenase-like lactoylglutathione lyase family enzyme
MLFLHLPRFCRLETDPSQEVSLMGALAIRHAGIVVSNLEASVGFYRDLLGLEVWWDQIEEGPVLETVTGVPKARIHVVKLKADNGVSIELLQYLNTPKVVPPLSKANDVGCNHVALQVKDLDSLYEKATAEGIRFNTPPLTAPGGKAKVTYCRDPEGVYVELVEILD